MALCDLELQTEIKDVAINTSNMDMAVLHENSVTLVHAHKDQGPHAALSDLKAERVIKLPFSQTQKAQQICFRGEEDIYVLLTDVFSGECSLYDLHKAVFHELPEEVSVNVSSIFPSVDHKMFCIATDTGVCELIETEGVFETRTLSVSPVITPWVEVVTKDEEVQPPYSFDNTTSNKANGSRRSPSDSQQLVSYTLTSDYCYAGVHHFL